MIRIRKRAATPDLPAPAPNPDDPARILERARELFRGGQRLEAIELLSVANRRRRDPQLERELVTMRFAAFQEIDWPSGPATVPEPPEDLFPGATMPEIAHADLTVERVRSAVLNHGCLIVRGLIDHETVDRLTSDVDRALAAYDTWDTSRDLATAAPWYEPFAGEKTGVERKFRRVVGSVLAVDSPPALFDVIEAFDRAGIRSVVQEFLGEQPALLAKKWTLRRVSHQAGQSDWHQDGAFMGGEIRSLNVWLSLSHCGDDAPGLDVVARRLDHVVPTGTDGAFLNWTVGPGMVARVAGGAIERPIFEPGDALIFDHLNLHRTAVDPGMTRDRYAIEAWFLAPSTYGTMMEEEREEGAPPRDQLPMVY